MGLGLCIGWVSTFCWPPLADEILDLSLEELTKKTEKDEKDKKARNIPRDTFFTSYFLNKIAAYKEEKQSWQ